VNDATSPRGNRLDCTRAGDMLLVTCGLDNRKIARKLCLAEGTIKFQIHNVLKELGLKHRSELAELMLRDVSRL
jgi:DNA-binding CsgD family transcriptional regulator